MNATLESPMVVHKPRKIIVPLAVGLEWGSEPDYVVQEKVDGRFATKTIDAGPNDTILAGEIMPDNRFFAFDCLRQTGIDIRHQPYSHRLAILGSIFTDWRRILPSTFVLLPSRKDGGALLREVLARGGEGIVRKRLDSPWGALFEACKRREDFICVVTGFNAGQSVQISRVVDGVVESISDNKNQNVPVVSSAFQLSTINANAVEFSPCGSVKLGGGKCDRVRVGSIVKITGFGLTRDGKIREPRPDADSPTSWLVKY